MLKRLDKGHNTEPVMILELATLQSYTLQAETPQFVTTYVLDYDRQYWE